MKQSFEVELREASGMLHGVLIQEGRAATGGRAELFTPGSIVWPSTGVRILTEHRGKAHATAFPSRDAQGRVTIRVTATDELREAVRRGKRFMSVEFRAIQDRVTCAGVREVISAYVDAATLTDAPEYDTTSAEIRTRSNPRRAAGRRRLWL